MWSVYHVWREMVWGVGISQLEGLGHNYVTLFPNLLTRCENIELFGSQYDTRACLELGLLIKIINNS